MNSTYIKTLYDSLENLTKSVIKDKIGKYHIKSSGNIDSIYITQFELDHFNSKKIEMITSESIEFDDKTSIPLEHIRNISDLLSILEYVEKWLKFKEDESILIQWSISDFEDCASEIEEEIDGKKFPIFNRSKFPQALNSTLVNRHYNISLCL
ncbi:MAG: hypothetical protein R6W78_03825 [Bacteroidales bacterium]